MVTLVAAGADVRIDAIGTESSADDAPLRTDSIFRIASLTEPITAVAALALVEEGLLRVEDPIDELLPELAGRRFLRSLGVQVVALKKGLSHR